MEALFCATSFDTGKIVSNHRVRWQCRQSTISAAHRWVTQGGRMSRVIGQPCLHVAVADSLAHRELPWTSSCSASVVELTFMIVLYIYVYKILTPTICVSGQSPIVHWRRLRFL